MGACRDGIIDRSCDPTVSPRARASASQPRPLRSRRAEWPKTQSVKRNALLRECVKFRLSQLVFDEICLACRNALSKVISGGSLVTSEQLLHSREKPGFAKQAALLLRIRGFRCGKKVGLRHIA